MAVYWYFKQKNYKLKFIKLEMSKYILKSLLSNSSFLLKEKVYFWKKFLKNFSKFISISFFRHYCILTGHARSISRQFKLVRHQCKAAASSGLLNGMRKSSF